MYVYHGALFLTITVALMVVVPQSACRVHRVQAEIARDLHLEALAVLKMTVATDEDPRHRLVAIEALEAVAGPESATWTQQALFDPDPEIRLHACLALGRRDPRRFETIFNRMLTDQSPAVRTAAMLGLCEAGRSQYREPIIEALRGSPELYSSPAGEPLRSRVAAWLEDSELQSWVQGDTSSGGALRQCATAELLRRGDVEVTRRLILTALSGPAAARHKAIGMLAWSPDPKVLYILQNQMENCPDIEGRLVAAGSLTAFGSAAGLETALRGLADPAMLPVASGVGDAQRIETIRLLACDACARIGDQRCLEPLAQLLTGEDVRLRLAAAAAIVRLTHAPGPAAS